MRLAVTVLFVASLTLAGPACNANPDENGSRPNIVFILADDIGYGDIGAYGGRIPTPAIDSLARDGMLFTDAHSPAALCAPSRFSILTGSYPYRNGRPGGTWDINMSSAFATGAEHLVAKRHITVADVLGEAGYATGFIGKMHAGGDVFDTHGSVIRDKRRLNEMDFSRGIRNSLNDHGFDYVLGLASGIQHEPYAFFENGRYRPIAIGDAADNSSTVLRLNGSYVVGKNGASEIVEADVVAARTDRNYDSSQVGRQLTASAVDFIADHGSAGRPFALFFSSQAIHLPHTPPVDFDGRPEPLDQPVRGTTGGATSDMIVELDLQVRALLAALRSAGVLDNTLVFFASDNGALRPEVTEYGVRGHDSNGPWRGYKASIYEGGHRVPFIVRWGDGSRDNSRIAPGSVAGQTVMTHDWVATIYDLLQREMLSDQSMDSATLLPVLLDGNAGDLHDFVIYQAGDASVGGIRQGDWVLVVDGNNEPTELYNLASDPAQVRNRLGDSSMETLVEDLRATLVEHHDRDFTTFSEPRTTRAVTPANTPANSVGVDETVHALGRDARRLNSGWIFELTSGFSSPNPGRGNVVDLPHTWNAADSADKQRPYHRGTGRYRKMLDVSEEMRGKKLYLYFEGVNQIAEVSVNGNVIKQHIGGYSAFAADISDTVRFGEKNEIMVSVSNEHDANVPPLNADFTFYGGIYRDVWLLALDEVHVAIDDYAANRVSIDVDDLSQDRAKIRVGATVANASNQHRSTNVSSRILDASGTEVAAHEIERTLPPASSSHLELAEFSIQSPQLWSPESPYLYRVVIEIRDADTVLDRVDYPLGLRWFDVDPKRGFFLNGEPYRLFGTNRHQDYPGIGNALSDTLHRRDLEIVKENGFNFLRLAHYPQDPAVLRAADELGLLLWEETPIVNLIGQSGEFRSNSIRMLREMIRQHRHHPSVAFWGYMNEVMLREPEPSPENYRSDLLALAAELDAIAKEEDPVRPTVMALSRDEFDYGVPLWEIPDIVAFNVYFGWYYEDFDALGEFLDDYRRSNPETPLMVSEYGAGSDERVHSRSPVSFDFSTELQQDFHEQNFRQILARPWLIASAVWNQFDFGSNHRQDTKFAINQKGLWFFDRTPKDIAAYYRARLSDEPVVHIAARDWPVRAGSRSGDGMMPLRVYSNGKAVDLLHNGKSLGTIQPENATATWTIDLDNGANSFVARSASAEDRFMIRYEDRAPMFAAGAAAELAVNAGGNEQITDAAGTIWEADRAYSPGSWGYVGGQPERRHQAITGTDDDPLYQTRREGAHSYRFDVPDGAYEIELLWADLDDDIGSLVYSVNGAESRIVIEESRHAYVTRKALEISGGSGVVVELKGLSAGPFLNAIRLRRLPS